MNYDKILAALETRLTTIPDLPQVAFENIKYDPVVGTPFIRTKFMPMDRRPRSMGLDVDNKPFFQRYVGIFQLLLHYPDSQGPGPTNRMVNQLCDTFDATTDLAFDDVYVTITQTERMRGINEGPWYKTPVHVRWYSYTK